MFEGVAAACITGHPHFNALTNPSVLEQVCPLLKDKRGRSYKFPSNGTQTAKNEYAYKKLFYIHELK